MGQFTWICEKCASPFLCFNLPEALHKNVLSFYSQEHILVFFQTTLSCFNQNGAK